MCVWGVMADRAQTLGKLSQQKPDPREGVVENPQVDWL